MTGKGDKRRPLKVEPSTYRDNWDRAFKIIEDEADALDAEMAALVDGMSETHTKDQIDAVLLDRFGISLEEYDDAQN